MQCNWWPADPRLDCVLYISVNYEALIIACSVIGGLLILGLTVCICTFQ